MKHQEKAHQVTYPFAVETVSGKFICVQSPNKTAAGEKVKEEYNETPVTVKEIK